MENITTLNLPKLIASNIYCQIFGYIIKAEKPKIPKKLGKYLLDSVINKNDNVDNFQIGIYKNNKGKKVFVKIWNGEVKDFNYYSLKNEIEMYKILNAIVKRNKKNIPKMFKNYHIPALVEENETKNSLIMIREYVDGRPLSGFSINKKADTFFTLAGFLKFLGNKMTPDEKTQISQRTAFDYITIYPLLLTRAIIFHPKLTLSLLAAIPVFMKSFVFLLKNKKTVLVHRDLHFDNILISKNRNSLIDLQLCVFTEEIYELVMTLRHLWDEPKICFELLLRAQNNYKRKNFEALFRGLAVSSATHVLSNKVPPHLSADYYADYLKFATNTKLELRSK